MSDAIEKVPADEIRKIENDLYVSSCFILDSAMSFADLEPGKDEVPEEWIAQYGLKAATRRYRIARAALLPSSMAPAGIKVAQAVVIGMMRGRGQAGTTVKGQYINMIIGESPVFPVQEVEPDGE